MGGTWEFWELFALLIGVAFPCVLAVTFYLALLGTERTHIMLMVEYYKQIKINADKERHLAKHSSKMSSRVRNLERDAIKVLKKENLIRFVERKPPEEEEKAEAPKEETPAGT